MSEADARREFELLRDWLIEQALPLWAERGVDRRGGGFVERLSPAGEITDDPRRARLIARQIYAFATARRLGWRGDAGKLVDLGLDALEHHYLNEDGTSASTLITGASRAAGFDLYDQAFVLFGWAAAASAGTRPTCLSGQATRLRTALCAGWAHPVGGFEEARPRRLPLRSNPHMHLLEAALAWLELSGESEWANLADEIVMLCRGRFMAADSGAIHEYFDGDWRSLEVADHAVVEPGHQFEWAWLLIRWGLARGDPEVFDVARRLIVLAEDHGMNADRSLAINGLAADLSPRDRRARLWPQTERIKVCVALAAISDDPASSWKMAASAAAGLRRFLLHPVAGAWWEHIGEDGEPVSEPTRASSLYHIVCAIETMGVGLGVVPKAGKGDAC